MKPQKRVNRKRKIPEENAENKSDGDFSSGSGDEWQPPQSTASRDKSENSSFDESQTTSNTADNVSVSDDLPFDTTAGFQLKIIKTYRSSNHPVWLMFAYLMKDQKIVNRVKDRFFCKKCFDKKRFKR